MRASSARTADPLPVAATLTRPPTRRLRSMSLSNPRARGPRVEADRARLRVRVILFVAYRWRDAGSGRPLLRAVSDRELRRRAASKPVADYASPAACRCPIGAASWQCLSWLLHRGWGSQLRRPGDAHLVRSGSDTGGDARRCFVRRATAMGACEVAANRVRASASARPGNSADNRPNWGTGGFGIVAAPETSRVLVRSARQPKQTGVIRCTAPD